MVRNMFMMEGLQLALLLVFSFVSEHCSGTGKIFDRTTERPGESDALLSSPTDHLDMFALLGDSVILPCGIPSIKSCSFINWNMVGEFRTATEVVKAGRVTAPNVPRLGLLKDCSLEINHLVLNDARLYSCHSGALNSSVLLQVLERK